jgi:hypothetical protein
MNPWLVFLGTSPGAPGRGDPIAGTEEPYSSPTLGTPHPKIYHPARYFDQIREAAEIIIQRHRPAMPVTECHSLLGNLNLSTRQNGRAERVGIDPACGVWIPDLIFERFRPRLVIALGLLGFLGDPTNRALFDPRGLLRIDWRRPDATKPFRTYAAQSLCFRIWNRENCSGDPVTIVAWPNHPSRVPFNQPALWKAAAHEFADLRIGQ